MARANDVRRGEDAKARVTSQAVARVRPGGCKGLQQALTRLASASVWGTGGTRAQGECQWTSRNSFSPDLYHVMLAITERVSCW